MAVLTVLVLGVAGSNVVASTAAAEERAVGGTGVAVLNQLADAVAAGAGVDPQVVDVPADDAVAAVETHLEAQPDAVAARDAGEVDPGLAPGAGVRAAIGAGEGQLAGERVVVTLTRRGQGAVVGVEVEGGATDQRVGAAVDARPDVGAVPVELGGDPVVERELLRSAGQNVITGLWR